MKMVSAAIVGWLLLSFVSATAAEVSPGFSPNTIKFNSVEIADSAKGGCWTNIGEAKRHAKEKIQSKGYQFVSEHAYEFNIRVTSDRVNSEFCYGSVSIEVSIGNYKDNVFGFHRVASTGQIFISPKNGNMIVLTAIDDLISKFPR